MHTGLGLLSLALAASSDWAPLPNQRCHNDFSQTHAIPSLAQCEALCDATLPCRLVSYCPLAGAAGCANSTGSPQPGTCWLYPASALMWGRGCVTRTCKKGSSRRSSLAHASGSV